MPIRVIAAAGGACVAMMASSALASPITLQIGGDVSSIFDTYGHASTSGGAIAVGDPLTIDLTYDPSTLIAEDSLGSGNEEYAGVLSYTISLPGYHVSGSDTGTFGVFNGSTLFGRPTYDELLFSGTTGAQSQPFDLGANPTFSTASFDIDLIDPTASALNTLAPASTVNGSAFGERSANLDFNSNLDGVIVQAENLTVAQAGAISAAPEPSTWALTFGGVAMIGAALRYRGGRAWA